MKITDTMTESPEFQAFAEGKFAATHPDLAEALRGAANVAWIGCAARYEPLLDVARARVMELEDQLRRMATVPISAASAAPKSFPENCPHPREDRCCLCSVTWGPCKAAKVYKEAIERATEGLEDHRHGGQELIDN